MASEAAELAAEGTDGTTTEEASSVDDAGALELVALVELVLLDLFWL
ncbi:hypothetical protein ACG92U_00820 [Leuconostoc citreum]